MSEFAIDIDVPSGTSAAAAVSRLAAQLEISGSAPLRPACVVCSKAWSEQWSERQRVPGIVPVERATIMREVGGRGYLAVVHCHGADAIVEIGAETPSDNKIRSSRAFG